MTVCELDKEVSGEILGWKVPVWQALLVHRVLPSCGGLVLYLVIMCFDFALVFEHYRNGKNAVAAFCLVLIVLPVAISLVFTLASPPASLQIDGSSYSINIRKVDCMWILAQVAKAVFFPIATIGRYAYLIFWWVDVVFASLQEDTDRAKEALTLARAPSTIELYLFLQAFIHSAPYAIVNILDMMFSSKRLPLWHLR
ncbi:unnamed protein product [Leptidea sinapis]|uniref:XK-related protein n=1 Tax=Leptidea sinapis TaxID=189913 RepID=A0A5E4PWC4_9NEOP|nr:unnamed protein product [Leptidea sinapis]